MSAIRALALAALLIPAASRADVTVWLNVPNYPDDLFAPIDGWSAVRIEAPEFLSLRCAADDFALDRPTRISAITFYGAEIGIGQTTLIGTLLMVQFQSR